MGLYDLMPRSAFQVWMWDTACHLGMQHVMSSIAAAFVYQVHGALCWQHRKFEQLARNYCGNEQSVLENTVAGTDPLRREVSKSNVQFSSLQYIEP